MTSQVGVETVQLSDYLKNLENACETPNFGYTHQSLEDEMVRQQTIEGSSKWIRESVTSSNHDILNQISYITERVETNKDCLHYLAGITSMEDIYSDVAAFNAKRALKLIMENLDNKFWRRKLSGPINRCWQNLGRYSELATIHLKNAADFHQFYYDARHLETKLYDRHKKFLYNRGRFAEMNHEYYTNSSKELRDWLRSQFDHLNYVVNRSKQLIEQSKSLVPIYLRTNRINSPVNGVMLCDYETPKFKLTAGERIVIVDNMAGGVENKQKFLLRTGINQEEDITSEASHNMTSDTLDICETDSDSHSRTEEIDDRSTDSNSYLRYPKPRITTMPCWNFGRGQTSGSGTTSSDQTSSTFTENVSPLGQSSSKLHWHVRSIDGKVEALVPSVCVWIPSPDMEAQEKAIKLYKVILDSWNYIIDEQLKICLQFFTILLQRFIESDGLTTDDDEAFKRFLNNLVFSLTEPPTAEAENFNKEFLRLIDATREHWNKTKTFGTRIPGSIHLRRTEIAIFQSLLDWNKAHMRTIKQYEQENIIPLDLSQKLTDLQEQSFHMMETVTLVNDLAQKDKKKLDSLLNQLRIWNKQTKDKNQFNIYSLSSSSDDEWLSSSGSEYINSESTYESVDETETSYIVHSKQIKQPLFTSSLKFPHKTFILPAIFTYDEEMVCSCTTSEEIQSIGTGSSCTTDDEIEDYQKYHSKQDFHSRSDDDFLNENKNFVTTYDKQMLLTLERPIDTKSKPITYKSRKYIDTKDGGRYSVVYIEVAPTEETNILDSTDQENLKPSTISKSTQSEDPSKKTRFTRRTWIEKQHVEEAKSLTKIEESARIIHTSPSKVQITDIGVEARPIFRSVECCTTDFITTTSQSITELQKQQREITKHRENVQTQTEKRSEDFIYAVGQYAHVKEITEAQFNQLVQREAEKLKCKDKGNKACQTYETLKSPEKIYKTISDDRKPQEKAEESTRLTGDFGCQYQKQIKLSDKQEHYLIEGIPKTTMTDMYDIQKSNKENRAMFGRIIESELITQTIAFVNPNQIQSSIKFEERLTKHIGRYVENYQHYTQIDEEKKQTVSSQDKKVQQTSSHTVTEAVGVAEREVQVTQTERPVVTSEDHRELKTVKPDHMMSVSASYAESPVQQPPPRHLTETATQATSVTTHIVESSQHEIVSKRTVQVKAPLITETASLELPTPEPVRKTSLVEATQFVKRSTVDQQIDTVPVSSSDVGAQTEPHKSLLDGAAHLSLKRTDATSQAKPVQLCMVDSWSEIHAPVVPVQQPPKPIQTLEACVQTVKESVCVVDSATSVSVKSPESVLDSTAAFVKRPNVNAEVQVDRVSTPVVSLTTHKLEREVVERSLCTSCGHRYVNTEEMACQTVQPKIEPVPVTVKTSNVAMQTSKFSSLCQTTSELVKHVTPAPYVESTLSMAMKVEKPVTHDVGMQFGMRVATRVMSSGYQVQQTSSHTVTEAVGVAEREVQVTQTERPVVTSEDHRELKTVKPDHMMSVSASYAESPVQQPPPRHLTETATQATSVTTHIVESSQHEIVSKRTVQVKAPLITETASLELPTPEPVRKTSLVEATQFVKRSTVDQQIDTVPVSSSDVGAQTEPHKSLLDGAAHLSLKRTDATSQAKPVQLCMVDSWSEIHAPVVPVQQPPKPIQTLEACVQTVKESVCVVDSATSVSVKSPESVLDSPDYPLLLRDNVHFIPSYLVDSCVCAIPSFVDCWCQCSLSSSSTSQLVDDCVYVSGDDSLLCPLVDSCCKMFVGCSSFGTSTEPLKPVFHEPKIPNLIDTSGFFHVDHDYLPSTIQDEDVPLDSGDLEWELVDDNLKDLHRCLVDSCVQTEESYICRPDSQKEYSPSLPGSQLPTVNRKNFSVQYIYEPAQENAGCQTQPMTFDKIQKHIIIDNQDAETMTDDIDSKVAVLFQNISSTDIRERLIERYYYSAPSSSVLVTDAEVQVNLTSSVYKGHTKDFYMKDISTDYVVEHHIENENVILEESSGHDDSEQTVSGTSYSRYTKRLLHEGSVTEVWEKCPPTHSVFDYYQSRREFGSVREQASMAMEEPVTAADVGIQIVFDSLSHSSPSESEISRSESPLSGSSYTYEAYLIRSRLGQVCEVQCQFCPTHIPTASQTDHYGISMQTERHEKFKEDIFEIYQRRLIKDQIAEAWTQVEQDSYTESRMEQVSEPIDVIEERILEITEKKSKKVYSQIKITEEFTEEEDLIVCELGVQTDPFYDQQYFIKTKESHSSMDLREESSRRLSTTGIQTSVIHLASIISSGDLEWADEDLCEVIKAGIRLLGSDGHKSEDISVSKYRSHQLNICSRLPTDSGEKVLISSGTQAIPIESDLEKKFQKDWQVEDISIHESAERFQSDDIVEKVGMLTEETHHMSKILVQLRQRTLQYELFESQYSTSCIQWNNIREVASPRTGLFAPVAMAIRRGWIRLGEVNEYVDPMTGVAIPLETAYQQGRIRLTSSSSHYDRNIITNTPVLLLIERVYFSWCKAYLTSVVNTATGEVLSPNLAIANGILETTEDEIRLLDSLTNTWITIEEGAGRQIIQLEPSTPTTESMEDELDEPVSCKVYQLTHVCPGGEPSPWLGPLEAVRLGLLNWETGEVAADWPARPMLRSMNSTGHLLAEDFIPTKWCSFLTAKQAGWLRFIEEIEPQRYLTTSGTPNKEPGSLILSTQVNLLAPSQVSLNYEHDDIEENYHHQTNQYHHEFNIPRTRSDDVFTTRDLSTSNLYHPFNILPDTRSVSCTRIDITSPLYNDYKLIPSRMQVRHENDEHSWTSETQIWEEYQETSSRTISPDNARGHQ